MGAAASARSYWSRECTGSASSSLSVDSAQRPTRRAASTEQRPFRIPRAKVSKGTKNPIILFLVVSETILRVERPVMDNMFEMWSR